MDPNLPLILRPNPPLNHPKFKLNTLPDPPRPTTLFGETPEQASKNPRLARPVLEALHKFHFWGINPCIPGRVTNARILRALMKLFYYMDDVHKPRSWAEACNFTRDAGPRLLSCAVASGDLVPVSRRYPDPPDPNGSTGDGYVRPSYAADGVPDVYVERMLQVSSSDVQMVDLTANNGNGNDGAIVINDDGNTQMVDVTMTGSTFNFTNTTQTGSVIRLPGVQAHAVIEAVERAVMQFAYADLERHPTAAPRAPRPQLIAKSEDDLYKSIVSSVPAASRVSISDKVNNGVSFDVDGDQYIYRGRGPVWRNNSCAVDCAIVVGRLLDAGSTVHDRKQPGWEARLSRAERAFIDATDANWDVLSRDESAALRDSLWKVLAEESPAVRVGRFNSVWSVWAAATSNIAQFQFSYAETLNHCPCRGVQPSASQYQSSFVTPPVHPGDKDGVSIQEVVARPFVPDLLSDCRDCGMNGTVTRQRRITNLPLRMVVTLDERVNIRNHTRDFTFHYCDFNGVYQKAIYRWLGGIYMQNNHFRVYWTDSNRGEANANELRMYDGMANSGLIFGGISPYHSEERVPPAWYRGSTIPLLIYERVMNPEPEVLNCAMHSVCGMMNSQLADLPILQSHTPWSSTGYPIDIPGRVWNPILPTYGDRFHETTTPYKPPITIEDDTTATTTPTVSKTNQNQAQTTIDLTTPSLLRTSTPTPQPFTVDPQATLTTTSTPNSNNPISLPISIPITQRLNQSNSAFLPSADPNATGIAGMPAGTGVGMGWPSPGGFFYIPSPSPSPPRNDDGAGSGLGARAQSPEWGTWIRMSPMCGVPRARVIRISRGVQRVKGGELGRKVAKTQGQRQVSRVEKKAGRTASGKKTGKGKGKG